MYKSVVANGVVCVNVLSASQQEIAALFGGKTPADERFEQGAWSRGATGAPVLDHTLVSIECNIVDTVTVGTHDVLICEPLAIAPGGASHGLVYFDRKYHQLA